MLASVYDVTGWAVRSITDAASAAAGLDGLRRGVAPATVSVEPRLAAAAFLSEALFSPVGWELPPPWDPIAGDYPTADGWIRLHTNYAGHRRAALSALGLAADADRDAVAAAVAACDGAVLETAVVDAGGAAAVMHAAAEWRAHEHGRVAVAEPLVRVDEAGAAVARRWRLGPSPLSGIRVLDLTRVIAGPECTSFLARLGADVVRVDPPGFEEVPALVPVTMAGKRLVELDIRSAPDRFAELVSLSDVVVHGLRPGALDGLGFSDAKLRSINPALVVGALDAYGWEGPWARRRGFDSLVQMSCGIAARGMEAYGADRPRPLPAQALDHGAGFTLAAAVCRALARLLTDGVASSVRTSLVGVANVLMAAEDGDPHAPPPAWDDDLFEPVDTPWGPARRPRFPAALSEL